MLVVDPAVQGRGIGELLVTHLPGPGPGGRQAPDGALHRPAHDGRAPALRAAGLHAGCPSGTGRPVPGIDLLVYARDL